MIKVVICEFEILVDSEEAIPVEIMLEIEKIRNKKKKFIITTKKDYKEILEYNKSYPFIDYIITNKIIYDVEKDKEIRYKQKKELLQILKVQKEEIVKIKKNKKVDNCFKCLDELRKITNS